MNKRPQILFLSHGGGPLPLLGDSAHDEMVNCLRTIRGKITKPSAIIVISAHWEEDIVNITADSHPPLIYDYTGFPPESYEIEYPCTGHPQLAETVQTLLENAGMATELNHERGFDHGLFVPLKILFPEADIPCIQVSLLNNLNPEKHIQIGHALRGIVDETILVIGSGFSFHNMRAFFTADTPESRNQNQQFEAWLTDTCADTQIDEVTREKRLVDWEQAPFARYCHPREEHLLPLHVCAGMAGKHCEESFSLKILNKHCSMFLW